LEERSGGPRHSRVLALAFDTKLKAVLWDTTCCNCTASSP
jgi:hypothetical protein